MLSKLILILWFLSVAGLYSQDILISEHPISVVECEGQSALLSVDAESRTGSKILYQWYKDNLMIPGAVSRVLFFTELKYSNSGLYFCRVYDENEFTDSKSVTVFALSSVSITSEPQDVLTYGFNGNVYINFEAHINGYSITENKNGDSLKIQWYQLIGKNNIQLNDDMVFNGTKTNRLSVNIDNLPDTTSYFAIIEGKCGKDTTKTAKIIKNYTGLEINLNELGYKICSCNKHSIEAEIKNPKNYNLDLRWFKDGEPVYANSTLKGTNREELIFSSISKSDEGKYKLEVRVKEINFIGWSNEIELNVMEKPEIVAVRIDSFTESPHIPFKIFSVFIKNIDSTYLDRFEDDLHIWESFLPGNIKKFEINDVYFSSFGIISDSTSKHWVVASNKCGIAYSDTLTIKDNLNEFENRDPWHQYQELCENQSAVFEINFDVTNVNKIVSRNWKKKINNTPYSITLSDDEYYKGSETNKLKINNIKKENEGYYYCSVRYYKDNDTNLHYDESPGFVLYLKPVPVIYMQPVNNNIVNEQKNTLFQVDFVNNKKNGIEVSFYKMKDKNSLPELIDKTDYNIIWNYNYVKDITFNDEGYYFALARHKNDCQPISTDTIKITVIPKGTVAGINENELNSGISISPNPASEYIEISVNNEASLIASDKVQIFNTLGIEVSPAGGGVSGADGGGFRIDVSYLHSGVYYIRIGDRVEKFVKM